MKKQNVPLLFEIISLQLSFAAGFLIGSRYAEKSDAIWWGVLFGALAFLTILWFAINAISLFRDRWNSSDAPETLPEMKDSGPPPSPPSEFAAVVYYLVLFLACFPVARFVARKAGNMWAGVAGGILAITGFVCLVVWLDRNLIAVCRKAAEKVQRDEPAYHADHDAGPVELPPVFSPADELAWMEPQAFRKMELAAAHRWLYTMVLLTTGLTVLGLGFVNWFGFEPEATKKMLITGGGIVVLFLVLFGFTRLMRIEIRITDKAVICELGEQPPTHAFSDIDHCEIGAQLAGGETFNVLVVELRNGDRETYAIDPSLPLERVRATLEHRCIRTMARDEIAPEEPV